MGKLSEAMHVRANGSKFGKDTGQTLEKVTEQPKLKMFVVHT